MREVGTMIVDYAFQLGFKNLTNWLTMAKSQVFVDIRMYKSAWSYLFKNSIDE